VYVLVPRACPWESTERIPGCKVEKYRAVFCPSSIKNINRSINYFDLISTAFTLYSSMVACVHSESDFKINKLEK
jgi:hypothetical protein